MNSNQVKAPELRVGESRLVTSATRLSDLPPPAFAEIAFGGRSNVGKSSLLNRLMGRRNLVRTSGTPGCTRGIDLYRVELRVGEANAGSEKATVDLIDLPGYGYAKRSKAERQSWGPLVESVLSERDHLRTVAVLVDARRGFEAEDVQLIEFLDHLEKSPVCVATKIDKVPASRRRQTLAVLAKAVGHPVLGFSATKDIGRPELWGALLKASSVSRPTPPE